MVTYRRKSYTRSDGTRVKSSVVHAKGSGRSRGRKTGGRFKSKKSWITREGKLGGSGFLSKSASVQHKLLDKCVKKYGYRSCLGSVMVLNRNKTIKAKYGKKLKALMEYLKKQYGSVVHRKSKRVGRKRSLKKSPKRRSPKNSPIKKSKRRSRR
jgi:hypothetical protein